MEKVSTKFCKITVLFVVIFINQVKTANPEVSTSAMKIATIQHEEPATVLHQNPEAAKAPPLFDLKPGGVTQIILTGSPWPDSLSSTTLSNETLLATTEDYVKPQTVLEYELMKPFHQPLTVGQPSGKPDPTPAAAYETVKPIKLPTLQTFPQDLVERFPELTTLNKRTTIFNSVGNKQLSTTEDYVKPLTLLEYKPMTSFYHPHPVTLAQIVPPGKPLPASAEGYETTEKSSSQTLSSSLDGIIPEVVSQKTTSSKQTTVAKLDTVKTTTDRVEAQTILEYKPITSFYHPHPVTLAQIVPPGKPLPASAEGYETTEKSSSQTLSSSLDGIIPEVVSQKTTSSKQTTVAKLDTVKTTTDHVEAQTVLEYKPITSFYHPNPVTIAQLVPSGEPWPASAEDYQTTKTSSAQTTSPSSITDRLTEMVSQKTTTDRVESQTVLEYKPITSFYHPRPITVAQIVPPGKPLPASAEGYQTTKRSSPQTTLPPSLEDRFPELVSPTITTDRVESQTVLEYEPITSFHHPRPVTVAQIVPPGKPWPASAEGNQTEPSTITNFSQTLSLIDRFPELTGVKTATERSQSKETKTTPIKKPESKETTTPIAAQTSTSTRIILTYKPQRPWYHPRPGNTVGQIIPPGKPWPSSPERYSSLSITTNPPWFKESVDNETENNELPLPHSKEDELQSLKEEPSVEPNALQYYGSRISAPPRYATPAATPFTSGTQKTTISDIVDILKELHNITLVSGNAPPSPSHLLPYDVDRGSQIGSPVVRRPPPEQNNQGVPIRHSARVYDGTLSSYDPANRDRVFANPKLVTRL